LIGISRKIATASIKDF
jgi:hypothetical protein